MKGFYLAAPYDNAVDGPTQLVTLVKKKTTNLYLSVPYQVPGTATGSITVAGIPAGVKVESYTVLACPSSEPWHGGVPAPECVSEYSGPGGYGYGAADRGQAKSANAAANPPAGFAGAAKNPINKYSLPTLTPGTWLLYAGYETALGSATNMTGTSVGITSGKTTTQNLTVRYKQPTQGAVTGTVTVIGAPSNGFDAGVFACSGLPTAKSCPGQVAAFAEQNGSYTTLLAPGTWWLEGFVDVFGGSGANQSTLTGEEGRAARLALNSPRTSRSPSARPERPLRRVGGVSAEVGLHLGHGGLERRDGVVDVERVEDLVVVGLVRLGVAQDLHAVGQQLSRVACGRDVGGLGPVAGSGGQLVGVVVDLASECPVRRLDADNRTRLALAGVHAREVRGQVAEDGGVVLLELGRAGHRVALGTRPGRHRVPGTRAAGGQRHRHDGEGPPGVAGPLRTEHGGES